MRALAAVCVGAQLALFITPVVSVVYTVLAIVSMIGSFTVCVGVCRRGLA